MVYSFMKSIFSMKFPWPLWVAMLMALNMVGPLFFIHTLEAKVVLTVEHLKAPDGRLHPIQQAMVDEHGSQCGFCTPGILCSAAAFLERCPDPSRGEIKEALSGNLCRCTGYTKILDAVQAAAARIRSNSPVT